MDVVCLQFLHKGRIASEIIVVIPDHHGHLDARAGGPELIENRLVRLYDVRKPFDPAHKRELPEAKRVAHDQKLGVGAFLFQLLQEFDELGGVIAMLQLTVATHVQVTDKVILLCQSMISLPDRSKISDRWSYTCAAYRPGRLDVSMNHEPHSARRILDCGIGGGRRRRRSIA
jgi:hypothetical protein